MQTGPSETKAALEFSVNTLEVSCNTHDYLRTNKLRSINFTRNSMKKLPSKVALYNMSL